MIIPINYSMETHSDFIKKCNAEVAVGYFDRIGEKPWHIFFFPFYLVFICLYAIYLALYGILLAIQFVQSWGLWRGIADIDNGFLRVLLSIIGSPIQIALYIVSLIFPIPVLILLWLFFGVIFLLQVSIIDHSNLSAVKNDIKEKVALNLHELQKIQILYENGYLSEEEYEIKKREIIEKPLV